jgi:hypothetical protein
MQESLVDYLGVNTTQIDDIDTDMWMDILAEEIHATEQWTAVTGNEYPLSDSE